MTINGAKATLAIFDDMHFGIDGYKWVVKSRTQLFPKKVIFNDLTTIVYWNDGTKTICTCSHGDQFTEEGGFAACLAKKMYGRKGFLRIVENAQRQENK